MRTYNKKQAFKFRDPLVNASSPYEEVAKGAGERSVVVTPLAPEDVKAAVTDVPRTVRQLYGLKRKRRGTPRMWMLKYTDTWTMERDFVMTEITKYPSCADVVNTDTPEIKLIVTKEEIMNNVIHLDMIPDARHPFVLPQPLYLKKGTVISFGGSTSITSPSDVRLGINGYFPIKDTTHNPILFGKPYLMIARFTSVTASTPLAPIVVAIEDWEIFTPTHLVALVMINNTDTSRKLTSDENFNFKLEVAGNRVYHREGHRWLLCGTPEYPKEFDPPFENLSGTQIYFHIYPPAWGDSYSRTVYIGFYGKMKYDFRKLKDRFN